MIHIFRFSKYESFIVTILVVFFIVVVSFFSNAVFAYPENVRHGYVNCTSCHVSPTGGGILTPYGRDLSREVLSTWGKEGEGEFLYGIIKLPDWLLMGGDARTLYLYRDNPRVQEGMWLWMQSDVEASLSFKNLWFVGTFGKNYSGSRGIISRRHYINWRPREELSFRGGRFYPAFGINTPDHIIPTKRGLGWDQGDETYNVEVGWLGESFNFYATGIFGRPDFSPSKQEKGISLLGALNLGERFKVGGSYYFGHKSDEDRHILGPFGILGFTSHFFLLSEFDWQWKDTTTGSQSGFVHYERLNYEIFQGLHLYLNHEQSYLNLNSSSSNQYSFGLGMQFFPRPHFELNLLWQKQKTPTYDDFVDFAWVLLHFYL